MTYNKGVLSHDKSGTTSGMGLIWSFYGYFGINFAPARPGQPIMPPICHSSAAGGWCELILLVAVDPAESRGRRVESVSRDAAGLCDTGSRRTLSPGQG